MAKSYRPYIPEQDLLLPPSLREWLPEDHLAFFVSDLIDQLDLSAITTGHEDEERGYPPYHPVMLTRVLVYAYCVGVFSSRKIQRCLVEDVAFRILAVGNAPDYRTIADFRKTHSTALRGFFEQVLHLARELGAPRVGRVARDRNKVQANASKHKAMSSDGCATSNGSCARKRSSCSTLGRGWEIEARLDTREGLSEESS
jgi:transposase